MKALPMIALVLAGALGGCSSARRGEPLHSPLVLNAEQAKGEQLYMQYCNKCHPEGAGGLGPALNNKPLPGPAVRKQIRLGAGEMPAFDDKALSDDDVSAISAFVLELQTPSGGK